MSKYRKMNPEWKAKWIAALRSGEYKQGTDWLYDPQKDSYCCLGVLQKIVDPKFLEGEEKEFPTAGVCTTVGLMDEIYNPNVCQALANMNDVKLYSFDQIADWIEENL